MFVNKAKGLENELEQEERGDGDVGEDWNFAIIGSMSEGRTRVRGARELRESSRRVVSVLIDGARASLDSRDERASNNCDEECEHSDLGHFEQWRVFKLIEKELSRTVEAVSSTATRSVCAEDVRVSRPRPIP